MTYNLKKADGTPFVSLPDNVIDTQSTGVALIGANAVNFGLYLNENFIYLMQNFANVSAPINPLVGQLWYDTVSANLKYYNGITWKVMVPPFDGAAGTATVSISGQSIALTLAGNQIIYAVSLVSIDPALLPSTVSINDTAYSMSARFPQGLAAGVTMATDGNNLRFVGVASKANAFASNMTISVTNSGTGSVSFDGSGNVVLPLQLSSVVTAGTYTKVTVGSNGIVYSGNSISNTDVIGALGYVPGIENGPANSLSFGSNIVIDGVISGSNIFYGNSNITITTSFNNNPMPTNGIILLPISSTLPTGWFVADGQTVALPTSGTVVTENLSNVAPTGTLYVQRVF